MSLPSAASADHSSSSSFKRIQILLGLSTAVAVSSCAFAQQIEYSVTELPVAPESLYDYAVDMNNHGEVVGRAIYPWNPYSARAWHWSPKDGFSFLPEPPGENRLTYAASAISDTGYIAGDGGGDTGTAWRYKDGEYTIIGALPGEGLSVVVDVNDNGDVAGYSGMAFWGTTMFKYTDADGLVNLTPTFKSRGGGINNQGLIVGGTGFGVTGFKVLPNLTIEYLTPLPGVTRFPPSRIMDSGMIVGSIVYNESSEPYYYTEAEGMVKIPTMQRWNWCVGVSDDGVFACSTGDSSGAYVWSEEKGAQWLTFLIDQSLGLRIDRVEATNARGQILAKARTNDFNDPWRNIILTPINPNPVLEQTELVRNQQATFSVTNAQPGDKVYFLYSLKGIGAGPCVPQFGDLCIDLLKPVKLIGTRVADPEGNARKTITVPANAPLVTVYTQAVAQRGVKGADSVKSHTVSASIQN